MDDIQLRVRGTYELEAAYQQLEPFADSETRPPFMMWVDHPEGTAHRSLLMNVQLAFMERVAFSRPINFKIVDGYILGGIEVPIEWVNCRFTAELHFRDPDNGATGTMTIHPDHPKLGEVPGAPLRPQEKEQ